MAITWTTVANPRWADSDQTMINLDVNFTHLPEETVVFTATEDDIEEHGRQLHSQAAMGAYGPIEPYVNNE